MSEDITVQVSVTSKKNVSIAERHSDKSVLFKNTQGHFHMVPEDMAINNEKSHKGKIIDMSDETYLVSFRKAIGYDDLIATKFITQDKGVISSTEAKTKKDMYELLKAATEQVAKEKLKLKK